MLKQDDRYIKIGELLGVFHDIDLIIRELYDSSSQVFMHLNSFLKDYSKKNNIVTSNATHIFDSIADNGDYSFSSELYDIFDEYVDFRSGTENELDVNLMTESKLNAKADSILLLIRNMKQDMLTLKFLFSNYKVISRNEELSVIALGEINRWEKYVDGILACLTVLDEHTVIVRKKLETLNDAVRSHSQKCIAINAVFFEELKSSISLIKKKKMESRMYVPEIREKLKSTTDSIANIIKHLQYHDIIRQKIEHIHESHEKITAKLVAKLDEHGGDIIISDDDDILSLIADLSGLQSAQLILISKEYQNALDVISRNFQKIAGDITMVSTVSHEFSLDESDSGTTLLNVVKGRLDRFLMVLDEYNSNIFNADLLSIRGLVDKVCDKANKSLTRPLKNLEPGIPISVFSRNNAAEKPNIVVQIASLIGDIFEKNSEMEKELSEFRGLSEAFQVKFDNSGFRTSLEEEQIKVMVKVSKVLDQLDVEGKNMDAVIVENGSIKKDVMDRLKNILNQADYNELFEKLLANIIGKLDMINYRLKKDGESSCKSLKEKNLKEMEVFYTVASERIVHDQVINDGFTDSISAKDNTDDYDIELF